MHFRNMKIVAVRTIDSIDWKDAEGFEMAVALLRKGREIVRVCSTCKLVPSPCVLALNDFFKDGQQILSTGNLEV